MNIDTMLPMSFLYVPGDKPELFTKAAAGPADALILDLEDAVPARNKIAARTTVGAWLEKVSLTDFAPGTNAAFPQIWVRVNADSIPADLDAVCKPALAGVFLAKCTAESLAEVSEYLGLIEGRSESTPQNIGVIGLVESAASLTALEDLATNKRLLTFAIGEVDLMADLRMTRSSHSESALDSIRARIIVACAAARLLAPVAPTSTDIRDLAAFEVSSRKMHDLGFRSRTAIHPTQVPVIQRVFTPSQDEVVQAVEIIEKFHAAHGGLAVDEQGRLIDAAVVRGAQETLQRSGNTAT